MFLIKSLTSSFSQGGFLLLNNIFLTAILEKNQTYFNKTRQTDLECKNFIACGRTKFEAKIKLCHKEILSSNMGSEALARYESVQKHNKAFRNIKKLFQFSSKQGATCLLLSTPKSETLPAVSVMYRSNITKMGRVKTETKWARNCFASNIFNSSCIDVDKLFQKNVSDSEMVKQ